MAKLHTHYVNLGVARDASPDVIRAAYQALSERFHPDRNCNDPDTAQMLEIVNSSYQILSDPVERRQHDLWIAHHEQTTARTTAPDRPPLQAQRRQPTSRRPVQRTSSSGIDAHFRRHWWRYAGIAFCLLIVAADKVHRIVVGKALFQQVSAPMSPAYVRPDTTPNGLSWPTSAGYIKGYQWLNTNGLSTVTVDNSKNDSDVFVKLVALTGEQADPVRWFYIPAFGKFTLEKVTAGRYDIRYRDLHNGALSRSEPFDLEEKSTDNGRQFTNMTMTLYKVNNGNMRTYDLSEAEF